jgi:ZZ-type zinc finger-containing protein 3
MEDEDEFLFETAHIALRSNEDYLKLIKHLTVLCSHRIQVQKDIESLDAAKRKALENPAQFVENVKNGCLNLPLRIEHVEIPKIDFSKYETSSSTSSSKESNPSIATKSTLAWTLDEATKLEELLIQFPPEAVESQRFEKIAKAMGQKSKAQIASRVQKFFKKLHEANLPIPGSSCSKSIRGRNKKSHRQHFKFERPSTFFPERIVPKDLMMKEDDDDFELSSPKFSNNSGKDEKKSKLLSLLKQIKTEKESDQSYSEFNCSSCDGIKFLGRQWSCDDCNNLSFCSDCFISHLMEQHNS